MKLIRTSVLASYFKMYKKDTNFYFLKLIRELENKHEIKLEYKGPTDQSKKRRLSFIDFHKLQELLPEIKFDLMEIYKCNEIKKPGRPTKMEETMTRGRKPRNFIRPSKINESDENEINDAKELNDANLTGANESKLDVDIADENKPKSLTTSEENFINNLKLAEFQADFDARLAEKFDVLMQRINEISSALSQSGIIIKRLRE